MGLMLTGDLYSTKAHINHLNWYLFIFRKWFVGTIDMITRAAEPQSGVNYEYIPFSKYFVSWAFKILTHLTGPPYRLIYEDGQIYYSQPSSEELAL